MNRRVISIVAAIVLAAVGTLGLFAYVRGVEAEAIAREESVEVLVVNDTIERGTPATDLAASVRAELVPVKVRADGSVTSLEELGDTVALVDLMPGEQLLSTRFADLATLAKQTAVDIPDGASLVTIALEPQRALGGRILPGDRIGVVASFTNGEAEQQDGATHLILHGVLVTDVQLTQAAPAAPDEESETPDVAPPGQLLVTLALEAPAVERVVFAAEFGRIWLSAEPDGAVTDGTSIQTRSSIYP